MTITYTLSRQDVGRLAIARQHLDARPRPAMLDVIRDLGCVQLDPIRAVERTHKLVLWSRLGAFEATELARLRFEERSLFEYWAHAASLVLTEEWPVYQWQMQRAKKGRQPAWFKAHEPVFVTMLAEIKSQLQQGPRLARELDLAPGPRQNGRWWRGSYVGRLLDYLWTRGEVTVYGRPQNHRQWGLAADFWPPSMPREPWTDRQITRFAAQKAIRALGVATAKQIKVHYTRHRYPQLKKVLAALVKEGVLLEVAVADEAGSPLPGPWYLHQADQALLAQIQTGAFQARTVLLSPFDNLICDRARTEQLWDFYFRIEIYVPKAKRQYGYYVLPILHGDRLIGRIDPRMDRKTGIFHVHHAYQEPDAPEDGATVEAIGATVIDLARFLGATAVAWEEVPAGWAGLRDFTLQTASA